MVKCTFCSSEIPKGTGKMYVRKDGRVFYFCSNKCNKNMFKLGRKPVNFKWTRDLTEVNVVSKDKPEVKEAPKEEVKTETKVVKEEKSSEDKKED